MNNLDMIQDSISKKQKVICDTNVWYTISEGKYSHFQDVLSKYQLVMTNISLVELISSGQIEKSGRTFEWIKSAFVAISKYAIFMSDNDVEHLMNVLGIEYTDEEHVNNKEQYKNILNDFFQANEPSELTYNSSKQIEQRTDATKLHCDILNKQIEDWRTKRDTNTISVPEIRNGLIWLLKNDIYYYLSRHQIKISMIPFATNQVDQIISDSFDLYLTAFSNFLYEKYQQPKSKIHENDFVDFRNLLYCNKGSLYLTFENGGGQCISGILDRYCSQWLIPEIKELRNINKIISQTKTTQQIE